MKGAERRRNGAFRKQEAGNGEADHAGIRAGGREADVLQLGKRPGGDEIPDMALLLFTEFYGKYALHYTRIWKNVKYTFHIYFLISYSCFPLT